MHVKTVGEKASYLRSYQKETCDPREEDRGRLFQAKERAFWGAGRRTVGSSVEGTERARG